MVRVRPKGRDQAESAPGDSDPAFERGFQRAREAASNRAADKIRIRQLESTVARQLRALIRKRQRPKRQDVPSAAIADAWRKTKAEKPHVRVTKTLTALHLLGYEFTEQALRLRLNTMGLRKKIKG